MLHSMTGFARQAVESPLGTLTCELRAVNHRYLDLQFKLPEQLRAKEVDLRQQLGASLKPSFQPAIGMPEDWERVYDSSSRFRPTPVLSNPAAHTSEKIGPQ